MSVTGTAWRRLYSDFLKYDPGCSPISDLLAALLCAVKLKGRTNSLVARAGVCVAYLDMTCGTLVVVRMVDTVAGVAANILDNLIHFCYLRSFLRHCR